MGQGDLSDMISEFLTQASQLADIEGAQGTARLLASMQRLVRYMESRAEWVPLPEEWAVLKDLMEIRKGRFGNRIHLGPAPRAALFVPHMALVGAAEELCAPDEMLRDPLCEFEIQAKILHDVATGYVLLMTVKRTSADGQEETERRWPL
jgi:hypothetical protein